MCQGRGWWDKTNSVAIASTRWLVEKNPTPWRISTHNGKETISVANFNTVAEGNKINSIVSVKMVADDNKTNSISSTNEVAEGYKTSCVVRVDKVAEGFKTSCVVRFDKVAEGIKTNSMASVNIVTDVQLSVSNINTYVHIAADDNKTIFTAGELWVEANLLCKRNNM